MSDRNEEVEVVPTLLFPAHTTAIESNRSHPVTLRLLEEEDHFRIVAEELPTEISGASGTGESLFEALTALREVIEQNGWLIGLSGAQLDVYPSAMSLAMGDGRKAYRLISGKQARTADLVDIFEPAKPPTLATIEAQQDNYKAWLKSL